MVAGKRLKRFGLLFACRQLLMQTPSTSLLSDLSKTWKLLINMLIERYWIYCSKTNSSWLDFGKYFGILSLHSIVPSSNPKLLNRSLKRYFFLDQSDFLAPFLDVAKEVLEDMSLKGNIPAGALRLSWMVYVG